MRRRDLIKLIAVSAIGWPLGAHAQQESVRRVGILSGFSEDEMRPLLAAFRSRMSQLGWVEGQNLSIETQLGAGDESRLAAEAGILIDRNSDVIIAMGTPGLNAVLQRSRVVPVVFTLVGDPVGQQLIASLARPGGNATGFTNFEFSIGTKWLELLKEVSPQLSHVTVIANPANAAAKPFAHVIEQTGRTISITITTVSVHDEEDIRAAISTAGQQLDGGLIVLPDSLSVVHSDLIVDLAERNRLPVMYPFRTFVTKGGLLTYGLDVPQIYRQAAEYADRILRGEKPADLPVQAPTKYELVINLAAAKKIGITIPGTLIARADEVIE